MLGLPDGIRGCLFDLDGVLTQTAKVHDAAWKEMFDDYLRERSRKTGEPFVPFDAVADYDEYVDGKPREDGVRDFLASRGITLPEGTTLGAVVRGEDVIIAHHDTTVQPDDHLILFLTDRRHIEAVEKLFQGSASFL